MPSLFQKNYGLDLKKSSLFYAVMLFGAMIAELLGGVVTDYLLRRTRNLQSCGRNSPPILPMARILRRWRKS
jgi:hypothetical protein